jgi:AraC-type DNA-binding domain-containing proteins
MLNCALRSPAFQAKFAGFGKWGRGTFVRIPSTIFVLILRSFFIHPAMNESANRARYETRLGRVLDHIYDHLDEPLDIDRLAEIACLSPYHWHRIYQAMYGETVATTVRRLRLHRAAGYLANGSMPIGKSPSAPATAVCNLFLAPFVRCSACRRRSIASKAPIAGSGRRYQETIK